MSLALSLKLQRIGVMPGALCRSPTQDEQNALLWQLLTIFDDLGCLDLIPRLSCILFDIFVGWSSIYYLLFYPTWGHTTPTYSTNFPNQPQPKNNPNLNPPYYKLINPKNPLKKWIPYFAQKSPPKSTATVLKRTPLLKHTQKILSDSDRIFKTVSSMYWISIRRS